MGSERAKEADFKALSGEINDGLGSSHAAITPDRVKWEFGGPPSKCCCLDFIAKAYLPLHRLMIFLYLFLLFGFIAFVKLKERESSP